MKNKVQTPVLESEFLELLEHHKEDFYRVAYAYVKNEDMALEMIQEAVYKAYKSLDRLKSPQYFKTWFTRILINQSINQIRSSLRTTLQTNEDLEKIPEPTANQDAYAQVEQAHDLSLVLDELTEEERLIITLRFYEDHPLKDIADMIDKPLSTVKSLLYRSLAKMKNRMKEGIEND